MKRKLEVFVENAGSNLSAYTENVPIITVGDSMDEIKKNIKDAIDIMHPKTTKRVHDTFLMHPKTHF